MIGLIGEDMIGGIGKIGKLLNNVKSAPVKIERAGGNVIDADFKTEKGNKSLCELPSGEKKYVVWIMADDIHTLKKLKGILKEFEVKIFPKAEDLTNEIAYKKPDIVLVDLDSERIDGLRVCRKIRRNFDHYELPVIFVTSKHPSECAEELVAAGANDIIFKPIVKELLIIKVVIQLNVALKEERFVRLREFSNKISVFNSFEDIMIAMYDFLRSDKGVLNIALFQENEVVKVLNEGRGHLKKIFQKIDAVEVINYRKYDGRKYLLLKADIFKEYSLLMECSYSKNEIAEKFFKSAIEQMEITLKNIRLMTKEAKKIVICEEILRDINQILFIKSESPYCVIEFKNKRSVLKRISLNFIILFFDDKTLIQTHKKYLVNKKKIRDVYSENGKSYVTVGEVNIPVGRSYKEYLTKTVGQNTILNDLLISTN